MALLSAPTPMESARPVKTPERGNWSQRIIAAGLIIGFCYWAASILMTLMLSVLLAYFLDPFVEWMERMRMPRIGGSLIAVLLTIFILAGFGALLWDRVQVFAAGWPQMEKPIREIAQSIESRIRKIERSVAPVTPEEAAQQDAAARVQASGTFRNLLVQGLGSLYSILLMTTFVPFLVFFMLAGKRDVWHGTMQLFAPTERTGVKQTLDDISAMLRSYVVGNAIVTAILATASILFFALMGLDYPVVTGLASGILNMVPYLGALLSMFPPLVVGLTKYHTVTPFVVIAGVLGFFHLIAANVLVPALVGRKVHLNALAVTVALLFWGWMWGAIGFILAIPITATIKVVCDHVNRWQPIGRWLGS